MARELPKGRAGFGQGRALVQRLVLADVLARRGEGPLARPLVRRVLPGNSPQASDSSESVPEEREP